MRYERVNEAIRFAQERHSGTDRDGDDPLPYVVHPVEVLTFARFLGGITDEDQLVAAVLHDTIEDTETTEEEIAERFGERAARIVRGLTRDEPSEEQREGLSKEEVWQLRSKMLLEEIARMPPEVVPIKLADRLSNIRESKKTKRGHKLERYSRQTKEILKIVPREANPGLWDAIQAEVRDA